MQTPRVDPRLSGIFEQAIGLSAEERSAFLDGACRGDEKLRNELDSLLHSHDSASGYFEEMSQKFGLPAASDEDPESEPGADILLTTLQSGLGQTYSIERELSGAGMSRVFVAEETALRRRVVIKILPPDITATVSAERFRHEIGLTARLQHPHIVPLLTANVTGLLLYYTMPYVAGESLRQRIRLAGALPIADAVRIWRDVLEALVHAHANGVVHRDIKPANILLNGRDAMVTDFGIARAIEAASSEMRPMATSPIGTPAYMAPEQVVASRRVDHRADLYAAGLVMYEMLTGHLPFKAATADEYLRAQVESSPDALRRSDVPPGLATLVLQCLEKNPESRPDSAEAVLAELEKLPGKGSDKLATSHRFRRLMYGATGAAIIAVSFLSWRASHRQPSRAASLITGGAATLAHVPPDSALRPYNRGIAEQRRRTRDGAIEAMNLFDRAIAADSEFARAWAAIARTAQFASIRGWTLGGHSPDSLLALAVRASQRAVELDSLDAEVWTVAGKVAGTVDPEDRAATVHALRRALALDSTYAEAWFELGLAEDEALHPAVAEQSFKRAAMLSPRNVQVLAFLAFHYLWYDDYASGIRWADSAITVDPTYFLARDGAAYLALATNRPAIAVRHAQASLRASGHEPPIPFGILATAAARSGDNKAARRYVQEAESVVGSKLKPTKHEAVYLASAWAAIGDTLRALHWISAYTPRGDLHFQLHLKRDPDLRWIATRQPSLLAPPPR